MFFERDGERVDIPSRMEVSGSGDAAVAPPVERVDAVRDEGVTTLVEAGGHHVALARVLGTPLGEGPQLVATIGDDPERHVLAVLRQGWPA